MKCPRCLNSDPTYFGEINGRYYCRKCVPFKRIFIDETFNDQKRRKAIDTHVTYTLKFALSQRQQEISDALIRYYQEGRDVLIYAVCGAGKTEIVFAVIAYVINHGGRVCFTIPRRALCVELYERFVKQFQHIKIGLLYGGHIANVDAPLVICTTHQLYRFVNQPFDLMLIDEADAYPYYGNELLNAMFHRCVGRTYIKMSATLTSEDIHDEALLIMNRRYHNHDLPVPRIILLPRRGWMFYIRKRLKQFAEEKLLIYVPLRTDVDIYVQKLKRLVRVRGVSSLSPDLNEAIDALREGHIDVLVTTTILERGITVDNAAVIVVEASHRIFDERTLIQIAGRVGRTPTHPDGDVIFLDETYSKEMKACIRTIKKLNQMAV